MKVFTIHISENNQKMKYLLGLIAELAKTEKGISIDESYQLNESTIESIEDVENGKIYKAKDLDDLVKQLNK